MKKVLVLIMAVMVSAVIFAEDGKMNGGRDGCMMMGKNMATFEGFAQDRGMMMKGMHPGPGMRQGMHKGMPTKEDFIKAGVTEENYNKLQDLHKANRVTFEKNEIVIKQKELEIKKLLLDDNKNWSEIEKIMNEIGKLKIENKLKMLKTGEEVKKYVTMEQHQKAFENARERMGKTGDGNKLDKKTGDFKKNRGIHME